MHESATDADQMPVGDEAALLGTRMVDAELFTSEGCSSCPPADALFTQLAEREGVIALAFHVDYWNYLGWSDPYSQEVFSERQRTYAGVLDGRVYTPELVVNGEVGLVGSQRRQVEAAIEEALRRTSSVDVVLTVRSDGNVLLADCVLTKAPPDAVLHLAVVERSASQSVSRGENRGRTLSHTNVVRVFKRCRLRRARTHSAFPTA